MIEVTGLTVSYPDGTKAVRDLSFTLAAGECAALMGGNGAGKTTLLLSLVGVLPPDAGAARICGVPVEKRSLSEVRRRAGLVFQDPDDQLFLPTIGDDLAFGPRNYGVSEEEIAARVDEVLGRLGALRLKDRMAGRISGGERRLAALGTVLVMEPEVLLLDEPTAFLDPRARRNLISLLRELPQTKLIATHDAALARELCSRVLLLREGRLFADGGRELLFDEERMDACALEALGEERKRGDHLS